MPDDIKRITSGVQPRGGVRKEQPIASTASTVTAKVFEFAGRRVASPDDLALDDAVRTIVESPLQRLGYALEDVSLTVRGKSLRCTVAQGAQPFCMMHLHPDLLPTEPGEKSVHEFSYLGFYLKGDDGPPHPLRLVSTGRESLPVEFDDFMMTWQEFVGLDVEFVAWSRVQALQTAPDPAAVVLFRLGLSFEVPPVASPPPEPEQLGEVVELRPQAAAEPVRPGVFISYSHKDDPRWIGLVRDYLTPLRDLGYQVWDDSAIEPGERWHELIGAELAKARIVVLLVSQNFENSSYIRDNELGPVLANAEGGVKVFPVALSYVAHDQDPMKSLLMPYQWAYGPPTDSCLPLDGLGTSEIAKVLVDLRTAIQTELAGED